MENVNQTFTWRMENYQSCISKSRKNNQQCGNFYCGKNNEVTWNMTICRASGYKNSLIIFVFGVLRDLKVPNPVKVDISISIYDSNDKKIYEFPYETILSICMSVGPYRFRLDSDSLNDHFTIIFKISCNTPKFTTSVNLYNLSDDLKKLMGNQELSDVIIIAYGREILAHRLILSARSPVFAAAFSHNMREKNEGVLKIDDIESIFEFVAFKEMLRFIYTGVVMDIDIHAEYLLKFSDKYQINGLKMISEKALFKKISVSGAPGYLIIADTYGAKELKKSVMNFIAENAKSVIRTLEFKELESKYPYLIVDLFRVIAMKK